MFWFPQLSDSFVFHPIPESANFTTLSTLTFCPLRLPALQRGSLSKLLTGQDEECFEMSSSVATGAPQRQWEHISQSVLPPFLSLSLLPTPPPLLNNPQLKLKSIISSKGGYAWGRIGSRCNKKPTFAVFFLHCQKEMTEKRSRGCVV